MPEFQEIAHSGGKITFSVITDENGQRSWNYAYSTDRPVPMTMISVYALAEQGIPIAPSDIAGPYSPPPLPGCVQVMVISDSEGLFGHKCPRCKGYWRSEPWPNACPYCGLRDQKHNFLSDAQRRFIKLYCETLLDFLEVETSGEHVIDLDVVADAAGKDGEKPAFYMVEESQQCRFRCENCDKFNDIIGRYGYCSTCATRNDLTFFQSDAADIRAKIDVGNSGATVRDSVSSFDNLVGQYCKQLLRLVPLSKRRAERLARGRFHDLKETCDVLGWFDIQTLRGLGEKDVTLLERMFLRRHVYEHNGGEADQIYIDKSKDNSVRLKQHLSESIQDLHNLIGLLDRMAKNIHAGFHELIPTIEEPIERHRERKKARGR